MKKVSIGLAYDVATSMNFNRKTFRHFVEDCLNNEGEKWLSVLEVSMKNKTLSKTLYNEFRVNVISKEVLMNRRQVIELSKIAGYNIMADRKSFKLISEDVQTYGYKKVRASFQKRAEASKKIMRELENNPQLTIDNLLKEIERLSR